MKYSKLFLLIIMYGCYSLFVLAAEGLACDEIRFPFLFGNGESTSTGTTDIQFADFDS